MATFNDLRKIALSLPFSSEDLHFGGPSFRVNKRKFALRWRETGQTILKLPKDRLESYVASRQDRIKPIRVGTAFWADIVKTLVTEAWSTVVSKTVAREYVSALGRDGRLPDGWRFLDPAPATPIPIRQGPPVKRRVMYQVAMSADGYLAGPNGEHDWITMDPSIDFMAQCGQFDTAIMGRATYAKAIAMHGDASLPGLENRGLFENSVARVCWRGDDRAGRRATSGL